jgi:peptide/nickel transport system substrate-binding protein
MSKLLGSGPYQLTAWKKDRYLSFRRKPHWWADRLVNPPFVLRARPPQIQFVIIPDPVTASLALQRGDLDLYPQMPAPEFDRLRRSPTARAVLNFYQATSYDIMYAGFNTRRPALADALTRQALGHLFDAAGLLRATQLGQGQRTVGMIHPSNRADYNDSLALLPFAPAKAAALLRQAGWQQEAGPAGGWQRRDPKGRPQLLRLQLRYRTGESAFEVIALQFRAAAAQLGIPVILQPTEAAVYTSSLQAGDFDVYVRVLKGNPFVFNFAPILHSRAVGAGNLLGFGTPASDRLIEAVAAADSPINRARLLRRFQAMMQDEAPLVPLFFMANRIAANRELTGLHVSGIKPGYAITAIERMAQSAPTP